MRTAGAPSVMPAEAGIQGACVHAALARLRAIWVPAFAGMALCVTIAGMTLLAGCATHADIQPQARIRTPEPAAAVVPPLEVPGTWWTAFGDPQLDRLVAQALDTSPTLAMAQARLARARAAQEQVEAAGRPQVDATANAQYQRYTATGSAPAALAGAERDTASVQLGGSWELDVFGRHRAALRAAVGQARASEAEGAAARVQLAAQVARSYFQLARLNDQLEVARRTLAQREESLRLVQDRVRAGLDTALEVRQGEGAIHEARQQLEALQEQHQLAAHQLAALAGLSRLAVEPRSMDQARPLPMPTELPADLLGRRADIAAARWRVEAAAQEVALARTQFYPNVNLAAFVGLSSIGLSRLLDADSLQWGVGPAVRLPVFDAGRLRAQLRGRAAEADLAVESYNAAVVEAMREVADQLASAQSITRQQARQRDA
ncbi:MAG TPA: efflux transporter outer membrane subunit, partial [Ramlibacter sp.]|nr:efflux transporter outer membrane subunit [Ramlibacter sp.]